MRHIKTGKIHFFFGVISIILILIAGTLMRLSTIGEGIVWILLVLAITPVIYFWIKNTKKHDYNYKDEDYKYWNQKQEHGPTSKH